MATNQHLPLTEKYRPRRFADVVGQEEAVETLKRRVSTSNLSSVIAIGPSGTGKTSLMRIFAHALHCKNPSPEPCGRCDACETFANPDPRSWAFYQTEFSGSEHNDHASVKFAADLNQARFFERRGFFIDEVQGLKPAAADALLVATENPRTGVFYTFATTDPDGVRAALRSRCDDVEFHLLTGAQSTGLLRSICDREGIIADPDALEMLAVAGRGSARDIVKLLDRVSQQGDITPLLLQKALSLGWTSHLLRYFSALLTANIELQEAALAAWIAPAHAKAKAIRNFMLYIHNYEVTRPRLSNVVDIAFHPITTEQRGPIVAGMRARAERSRMTLDAYWLSIMDWWNFDYRLIPDDEALTIRTRKFNRLVNEEGAEVPDAVPTALVDELRRRQYRTRSTRIDDQGQRDNVGPPKDRLTLQQAEAIYDAASFLPQEYGVWFNASVQLRHGPLGKTSAKDVADLVLKITHELPMRVRSVSPAQVHWISLQTVEDDGPVTYLVLHIPDVYLRMLEEWLVGRLRDLRGQGAEDGAAWPFEANLSQAKKVQTNWHWRAIRQLWGGLDPARQLRSEAGVKERLIDLLGVPKWQQRSIGVIAAGRRFSSSGTLAPSQRKDAERDGMKLISAFADGAWKAIGSGWEIDERADRAAEREQRTQARKLVEAKWPVSENELEQQRRVHELAVLDVKWAADPRARRRSWTGWWS